MSIPASATAPTRRTGRSGRPTILDRAINKTKTIMATHYPRHVPDAALDDAIRAKDAGPSAARGDGPASQIKRNRRNRGDIMTEHAGS